MNLFTSTLKQYLVRSDVEAALKMIAKLEPNEDTAKAEAYIRKWWPGYFDPSEYGRIYSEAGLIESKVEAFDLVGRSWRFHMAREYLSNKPREDRILDFGCSRGLYSINLHNAVGKQWTLLDIDSVSIDCAKELCQKRAQEPGAFDFIVGDESTQLPAASFDGAMIFETLEHVIDPMAVLKNVQQAMKPGGYVLLSLPSGPIEYSMWVEHPQRNREHIREFTLEDLCDLFGSMPDFLAYYTTTGRNKYVGIAEGFFFLVYKQGPLLGQINWARKLSTFSLMDVPLPGW